MHHSESTVLTRIMPGPGLLESFHTRYQTVAPTQTQQGGDGTAKAMLVGITAGAGMAVLLLAVTTPEVAGPAKLYTVPTSSARGVTTPHRAMPSWHEGRFDLSSHTDVGALGQALAAAKSSVTSLLLMTKTHVAAIQAQLASTMAGLPPTVGVALKVTLIVGAAIWTLGAVTALMWATFRLVDRLLWRHRDEAGNSSMPTQSTPGASPETLQVAEIREAAEEAETMLLLLQLEKERQKAQKAAADAEATLQAIRIARSTSDAKKATEEANAILRSIRSDRGLAQEAAQLQQMKEAARDAPPKAGDLELELLVAVEATSATPSQKTPAPAPKAATTTEEKVAQEYQRIREYQSTLERMEAALLKEEVQAAQTAPGPEGLQQWNTQVAVEAAQASTVTAEAAESTRPEVLRQWPSTVMAQTEQMATAAAEMMKPEVLRQWPSTVMAQAEQAATAELKPEVLQQWPSMVTATVTAEDAPAVAAESIRPEVLRQWASTVMAAAEGCPLPSEYQASFQNWKGDMMSEAVNTTAERAPQHSEYRAGFQDWKQGVLAESMSTTAGQGPAL